MNTDIAEKNKNCPDEYNPFDNLTENRDYNESYRDIVPQIEIEGCKLPNIPAEYEKKRIRHLYNIAGGGLALHFIMTFMLSTALQTIIALIIMFVNNISFSDFTADTAGNITKYIQTSSIMPAIIILTYLISNVTVFLFGTKLAGFKLSSYFRTTELTAGRIIQYTLIAVFMQYIAGVIINFLQLLVSGGNIIGTAEILDTYTSPEYAILSALYAFIVAPVTEELLYRGLVMKAFGRVSQRFGIIMSAFFFGIGHGNIAQFVLSFSIGILMGYIDVKHNSLVPSIIVHMAINIQASAATFINNYFPENITVAAIFSLTVMLLATAGLVMLIIFCRNNIFPKADIRQQFRCKNIALTSVGTIAAIVLYVGFIIAVTLGVIG